MKTLTRLFLIVTATLVANSIHAQHGHLEAGATAPTEGSPLIFANGDTFAAQHGFVQPLVLATDGPYAGYYHGNITMTVRAATLQRGGPEPNHPALGAELSIELMAVEGPSGGTFAFWEHGSTTPTISLLAGATGTERWILSENGGAAGSDPYGHVHGRRLTADSPGIYTVTFRLHDESTHGTDGTALHVASEPLQVRFIAGDGIPVTTRHEGDYVIDLALNEGALNAAIREDDGHTDHEHDALNLEKTRFGVRPHYRSVIRPHESFLGHPGQAIWTVDARTAQPHGSAGETPHEQDPGHGHGHNHASTIEWDGTETPTLALEAIADPAGGFNVYLDLNGFEFSPQNASREHVPGQGHGHIFVDGERLGRVYHTEYFVYALPPGEHTILVTLNANTHEDYTLNGQRIEALATVAVPEPSDHAGGGHGHQHGPNTREWDGGPTPQLALEVFPDPGSGWNLLFDYEGFHLNPRNASQHHVVGEGHTHIYANGEKLTRLYGNAYHIPTLPAGEVEVSVRLSANDHQEYTVDGAFLEVVTIVHNGEAHEPPTPLVPLTLSLSTQGMGHGHLAEDSLSLSLTAVDGPGDVIVSGSAGEHHEGDHEHGGGVAHLSSLDGLSEHDRLPLPMGALIPLSWSFTAPGTYSVSLTFSGQSAAGESLEAQALTLSFHVLPSEGLHYAVIGNELHLSWDSEAALQRAPAVHGHYHVVEDAHGHMRMAFDDPMAYFRLEGEGTQDHHGSPEGHGDHTHP